MLPAATRPAVGTDDARPAPTLYLAFELGNRDWKLGFTTGFGQRRRAMQAYFTATRTPPLFLRNRALGGVWRFPAATAALLPPHSPAGHCPGTHRAPPLPGVAPTAAPISARDPAAHPTPDRPAPD